MRLSILGVGYCGVDAGSTIEGETRRTEKISIKEFAEPRLTRRFGRLAKLFYVAAMRALEDAETEDSQEVAIIGATAMGEVKVAVDLISQIHASSGKTISPKLVPNSVHNSPIGHLSIGLSNRMPQLVVSQGWLSGEAALSTASDFIESGVAKKVLVVAGDEADPSFESRLQEAGATDWSAALKGEAFQECASAVMLGPEHTGSKHGRICAGVERIGGDAAQVSGTLAKHGIRIHGGVTVNVRLHGDGGPTREGVAGALGRDPANIRILGPKDGGKFQGGGLTQLVLSRRRGESKSTLELAFELDELAFLFAAK